MEDKSQEDRIESWKEIASYLKRDVRTVIRWEKLEGLPVHRQMHQARGNVFAYPSELEAWKSSRILRLTTSPPIPSWRRAATGVSFALAMLLALISMASGPIFNPTLASAQGVVNRQVWVGPDVDPEGRVSRDGRYITYPYWDTGDLAIFDIATGEKRQITHKGTWSDNDEFAQVSTPSPDGRQIAFAWYKGATYELRVIGIDGSQERTLYRNDNVTYMEPMAWSPNGEHIFASFYTKDNKMQVVSVSVANGGERVYKSFPSEPFGGIGMSLSPDGRYLAYSFPQSGNSSHSDIACLATQDGSESPLIQNPADDGVFGWTPDGRSILFMSDRTGQNSLWALDVVEGKAKGSPRLLKPAGGSIVPVGITEKGAVYYGMNTGVREIYAAELDFASGKLHGPPKPVTQLFTGRNSSPDWSPDGSRLAYLSVRRRTDKYGWGNPADTIVIRTLATGKEREIALDPVSGHAFQGLRWAPDGRSLVIKGVSNDAKRGAYRVDANTGKLTLLIQDGPGEFYSLPQLTPDNKAFVSRRNVWADEVPRIVVHNLGTGKERELVRRTKPAWITGFELSPDGRQLAFATRSETGGTSTLNVVPYSGGEARELLRLQKPDTFHWDAITWTPDGRHIVFGRSREGSKDLETTMWKIPAQGGEPQKLELAMDTIRPLRIHPGGRRVAFAAGSPAWEIWVMENYFPTQRAAQ